jgi:spoIIIJ-associated protein
MTNTTYTGKNVDVAVAKAADALSISTQDLKYEVLAGEQGGFALIRILGDAPAGDNSVTERLSGSQGSTEESASSAHASGEIDSDRGGRDRDRGGRDRDRGGSDRDRGGRDRDRGGRDRDRGGRDRDRGARPRGHRSVMDAIHASVPTDGPTEVSMILAAGTTLSEIGEDAHEVLKDILEGMSFGVEVTVTETEDLIRMEISGGSYSEVLLASDMALTDALQHLVDKTVNFDSDDRKKVLIDTDGRKEQLDEGLADTAREVAKKVMDEGKAIRMGPMDARSRRLVHIALRDFSGVTTRSEGEGAFRRVCILREGN